MKKIITGITAPGSVVLLEGQLRHFTDLGYETYLLAPADPKVEAFCEKEGCKHLRVDFKRDISLKDDLRALFLTIRIFRKIRPDIINVGTPKAGLVGSLAGFLTGTPKRIYTCRGFRFEHEKGMKRRILLFMERITGFCAHKVICISPSVREKALESKVFKPSKTLVIHFGSSNGIPLERFSTDRIDTYKKEKLKEDLGLKNRFVYGFVGRLIDRKGITELYKAFASLNKVNPETILLIVGPPEIEQIKDPEILKKMEDHPSIILTGSQKDVPLYLSLMDVFVLPAWWEGFGNVLIQAAAMGVPVISTTGTGTRDAVSDGHNGILVRPHSTEELMDAMTRLYNDNDLRKNLGENGPEWSGNFDSRIIWKGMEELYNG